jgi:hypothetical protein
MPINIDKYKRTAYGIEEMLSEKRVAQSNQRAKVA